jgi:hypothetical protein
MCNVTTDGENGMSLETISSLVETVAEVSGADVNVARIALEAAHFDVDSALDLIIHGQWLSNAETAQASRKDSLIDLAKNVAEVCSVSVETATAVLQANNHDVDSSIEMLIYKQTGCELGDGSVRMKHSSSFGCTHNLTSIGTKGELSGTEGEGDSFVQGEKACYLKTNERVEVLFVHADGGGKH